jgi:hypothetical protein
MVVVAIGQYPPELMWNPTRGYSCTQCNWEMKVHIQPELPPNDDKTLQAVREAFAGHVAEKHSLWSTKEKPQPHRSPS